VYIVIIRMVGSYESQSDSQFHVLEPVLEKIYDRPRASRGVLGLLHPSRSDWFKTYKEFRLPSDAFDLVFLKSRVAILSATGFEIMDLNECVFLPFSVH
jgi:hypothetical protein